MARLPVDSAELAYIKDVISQVASRRFDDSTEVMRLKSAEKGIASVTVPDGRFGVFRPKQGPSGTWHWGTDLAGKYKTPVIAPEDMDYVAHWNFGPGNLEGTTVFPASVKATVGFSGYGPCGLVAKGRSGVFHLLAHLDPDGWDDGAEQASALNPSDVGSVRIEGPVLTPGKAIAWRSGEQVGFMPPRVGASGPHVHWELRREVVDSPATRGGNTFNPVNWLASDGTERKLFTHAPVFATKSLWWLWVLAGVVAYDYSKRRR